MDTLPKETSLLVDGNRTVLPSGIRELLALKEGDQIRYTIESGRVYIEAEQRQEAAPAERPPRTEAGEDPALGPFLDLLAADIEAHPERLQPFTASLRDEVAELVEGVEADIDAPLSPEDE